MDRHFIEECISNSKMRGTVESDDERWLLSEDPSNNEQGKEEEDDDEDEDALSLCDLPINEENRQSRKETIPTPKLVVDPSEDFNFCSWGDPISKESEMCAADELFFQGQILPMRHSISFDNNVIVTSRNTSRCLSRSESMGNSSTYSVGFTSASSRSSSINSHHSSISSGSTNSSASIKLPKNKSKCPKIPNQFQFSHPSPKPQIRYSNSMKRGNTTINSNQNSTFWSFLRVGLVTTPEIAMQDLKFRSKSHNSSKNFGSRKSTGSINSTTVEKSDDKKQRRHQRKFFDRNSVFLSGCKCSSNSVVGPIPSRVQINAVTRSASAKGVPYHADREDENIRTTITKHRETGRKQSLSRHRTFEWLRQLSLEAGAASPVVIDEAEKNQH